MSENNEVNHKKLQEMEYLVLDLEDENSKTKELGKDEMVGKIKDIIVDTLKDKNF